MGWEILPHSIQDWFDVLNHTQTKLVLALLFLWYAIERTIGAFRKRKKFGEFPFDKRHGVTAAMQCSLNMAIALAISVAIFEVVVKGSEFIGRSFDSSAAAIVAKAYEPLVVGAGLTALGLILSVYWSLFVRHRSHDAFKMEFGTKLSKIRSALRDRGFSDVEVLSIPSFSIAANVFVLAAPYFIAA